MTTRRETARYNRAPLRGMPRPPRTDQERQQRWAALLEQKNQLITHLRTQLGQAQQQITQLRSRGTGSPS